MSELRPTLGAGWRRLTVGDEKRIESPDSHGFVVGTAGQFEDLGAAPVHACDLVSVSLYRKKQRRWSQQRKYGYTKAGATNDHSMQQPSRSADTNAAHYAPKHTRMAVKKHDK